MVAFPDIQHPTVPYYFIEGQNQWFKAPKKGDFYYDPIEDHLRFKICYRKVRRMVNKEFKDVEYRLGQCHQIAGMTKALLYERYGIDWHTTSEMNPGCFFD